MSLMSFWSVMNKVLELGISSIAQVVHQTSNQQQGASNRI